MSRTATELRQLLYERRWQAKHFQAVQRDQGDEVLFDALFGVFTNTPRPTEGYRDQILAGELLCELRPACRLAVQEAIRYSLPHWNFSVPDLPRYLSEYFGRDAVLQALSDLETHGSLTPSELQGIHTYKYWLKAK